MSSAVMTWPSHRGHRAGLPSNTGERTDRARLSDGEVDSALAALFSDLEAFEDLVLPALGHDLASCEKLLSDDPRLGFAGFLGLFFAPVDDPAEEERGGTVHRQRAIGGACAR